MSPTPPTDRRRFLRDSAAAAAFPLVRSRRQASTPAELPRRRLGRTGRELPVLGLGCFPAGAREVARDGVELIHHAWERGARYFDTAPSYANGKSERRVGIALREVAREELYVNTKTLKRDGDGALAELEESLERLGMDYVDCVQVHAIKSLEDVEAACAKGAVVPALVQAKRDGKVRHVGITCHRDPAFLVRALELFEFETALVPVNPLDCHHRSFTRDFLPLAARKQVGLIAMKVYAGGKLVEAEPPGGAVTPPDLIRFALSRPGVAIAVPGADSPERYDEACDGALANAPRDAEARAWIEAVGPHRGKESEWYKAP